ncbi:MAG TPA: TM0106 family RecB-like putative nuclease [Steroidobacteraceae bacterium]|nr:TM0106 family RecB-like putative nuclease [Steroidobacteraceae bacterium]
MKQTADTLVRAPTDLSNYLGCRHLSALDMRAARGELQKPVRNDPFIEDLRERGLAHERAYLDWLRSSGLRVAGAEAALTVEATLSAMRAGVDAIYQGRLEYGAWSGRADFLLKVAAPSALGAWSYEACDTKLARETKAGTILQLCVYSSLLERLQGARPVHMHVVTPGPGFTRESHRVDEYGAYFRLLERSIDDFLAHPDATYPEMVQQCDYCSWWSQCEQRRRDDDHLGYVAGISSTQIKTLRERGIDTLAALAALDDIPQPSRGSREALVRVREQARAQLRGRERRAPYYEIKDPLDTRHGLALLPEPTPDDIFLDFEGDHFAEHGVQEYLLGYVTRGADGEPVYTALWAGTLAEERAAFERFLDLLTQVRARNPAAHVYHFAPYEPAALKRLMGRHATREIELDALLRGRAFVDLHTVVKRALIASVERYSIKDLEPFFGYARAQDLREASMSRRIVENAIAAGVFGEPLERHRGIVESYNREDCESALRLRDWLERLRAEAVAAGQDLPRPAVGSGESSEEISELDQELRRLRDGLLEGVPIEPAGRSHGQQARFVLAHMMEFHRREDKAAWWEYFRLRDLEEHELVDERRALAGLEFKHAVEVQGARTPLHRYSFPPQELDARRGDDVRDTQGEGVGTVHAVNLADRTIDIKKMRKTAAHHPRAVFFHKRVDSDTLRESLMRLGEAVIANGFQRGEPWRAAIELLLRRPPPSRGDGESLQRSSETTVDAACRIALDLDGNVLAIQGPPGTGKTYTGAHVICALARAGLKVGVTAVSHKVIVKLLEGAAETARELGQSLSIVDCDEGPYDGAWGIERTRDYVAIRAGLADGRIQVAGGTAWCWARADFEQSVDVLIVDEAGQMSLANVLATAQAARSLVLLGDPQQLEQPLQGSHPEGSEVSALYHVLDGEATIPADKGLFLAETWRLHPGIAKFTSEVYYEGRVESRPRLERQAILMGESGIGTAFAGCAGSGLRYVAVPHTGNRARSAEEVATIGELVDHLLNRCRWRDKHDAVRPLELGDILIVAPYNAQVSALIEALPALADRIGTVDRFQGQEAPVVIYSMTSSSPEDAPRGMEFLYDRFRFNVATSRAKALCILVGSPMLFRPECRTPRQMRMANGFCRYLELARDFSR